MTEQGHKVKAQVPVEVCDPAIEVAVDEVVLQQDPVGTMFARTAGRE